MPNARIQPYTHANMEELLDDGTTVLLLQACAEDAEDKADAAYEEDAEDG